MAWMIVFTMLIFSNMVSGVSALFLSCDNEIIFASPTKPGELYLMKYLTTTLYTSWMMVIFSLPVFGAYGRIFSAGPLYLVLMPAAVVSIAAIASGIGLGATVILVNLFPARRTKDIVVYLSFLFGILLYLVIRLIRPEDLADPERFPDFIEYLSSLSTPAAPLLPPTWASNLLIRYLQDHQTDWLLAGLLLLTPLVCYFAGEWIMDRWFFSGFSKAQESFGGSRSFKQLRYRPSSLLWFCRKEIRMFLRDSSQWSQLFLIGALIIVYLYNFKVLPLDRSPIPADAIANIIAYANIGLTGFLIASLSARFVFPAIGAEGSGFGLTLTAPLSLGRYMLYKYLFYILPLTVIAVILLIASNHLLQVKGPMLWISVMTGLLITWTVVAMALGFGAGYADFRSENQAATLGGFGAILFLFSALSYELLMILLASIPAYRLVNVWRTGIPVSPENLLEAWGLFGIMVISSAVISIECIKMGLGKVADNFH